MAQSRTLNMKKNIISGTINKAVVLFLPFVLRTVMIQAIGIEYLGLNSLFSSILQVLSISELGIGAAITYSMYKPIAQNNLEKVCALLNFYKKTYRIIGCIFLAIGLLLFPFLQYLINGSYPSDININLVYLAFLLNSSVSYFFFSYKSALLTANQKQNIINNVHTVLTGIISTVQIIAIFLFENYYTYLILMVLMTILNNIVTAHFAKKYYPQFICSGDIDKETLAPIKKQIFGLLINKLCYISRNSFDAIFISAFLGLTVSAIYGNYYTILRALFSINSILTTSIVASIGNSIATESRDKNYADLKKFDFLYMCVTGWMTICLVCLFQPFMTIWMGAENLFEFPIVVSLCVYFYLNAMGNIRTAYSDAAGLWWQNKYRAIFEAVINVLLNYFLGKYFGVIGIVLATNISLFVINFCIGSRIAFVHYFKNKRWCEYLLYHFKYAFITFAILSVTYYTCSLVSLNGIAELFIKGIIAIFVPAILYVLIYSRNNHAKLSVKWLMNSFLKRKM